MNGRRDCRYLPVLLLATVAAVAAPIARPRADAETRNAAVLLEQGAAREVSVIDGVFTGEQAARGRKTFQTACASCHVITEQTGKRFVGRWRDSSLGDIFDLIAGTMPDGNPGSLTPEEYAGIVAFYLQETGYPEGPKELPARLEDLMKVRVAPPPGR